MEELEEYEKQVEQSKLYQDVLKLYVANNDYLVELYFDTESQKNLEKKKEVLTALNKGEEPKNWKDILELLPKKIQDKVLE